MLEPARRSPRRNDARGKGLDFADEARFLKSWFDKPLVTGAVSPSGKALARMMARYVDPDVPGLVLEIGPGTGPVTEALIERGVAPERLVLIEFNPEFVPLLQRRFPGVTVVRGDAYAVRDTLAGRLDQPLTATVSSLPLLTKPVRQRARLLNDCFEMSRPGAPFIQFTYGLVPPIPRR
jgi:phosphatidylethanolamine/phosphatidyl-N-methylethanolamine N-methyltransferase